MIQPSLSTTVLPPARPEQSQDDGETSSGLSPIVLSAQARERLRVLNQALASAPPSANRAKDQQSLLQTIDE